jgi:hypothetical protein
MFFGLFLVKNSQTKASQGGPCPRTTKVNQVINILNIEVDKVQRQAKLTRVGREIKYKEVTTQEENRKKR